MKLRFHHILYFCSLIAIISLFSKEMPSTIAPVYELSWSNHSDSNKGKEQDKEFPKEEKEEDNEEDTSEDNKEENDKDSSFLLTFHPTSSQQTTAANFYTITDLSNYSNLIHCTALPFYILFACQKINC